MDDTIDIPCPLGPLRLRPEREEDVPFRFRLFCDSRAHEFTMLQQQVGAEAFAQIMRFQFQAQNTSYRAQFPKARFDIVELAGEPIGRIVVDRPGTIIHIVDQAIVPQLRGRGIGTAMMRAIMAEANAAGQPVRLEVASANDPSLRLYQRLGFVPIETDALYMRMEWRPPSRKI